MGQRGSERVTVFGAVLSFSLKQRTTFPCSAPPCRSQKNPQGCGGLSLWCTAGGWGPWGHTESCCVLTPLRPPPACWVPDRPPGGGPAALQLSPETRRFRRRDCMYPRRRGFLRVLYLKSSPESGLLWVVPSLLRNAGTVSRGSVSSEAAVSSCSWLLLLQGNPPPSEWVGRA